MNEVGVLARYDWLSERRQVKPRKLWIGVVKAKSDDALAKQVPEDLEERVCIFGFKSRVPRKDRMMLLLGLPSRSKSAVARPIVK